MEAAQQALPSSITDSAEFKNSVRLKDFLNYIVEEARNSPPDTVFFDKKIT